MVEEFNMENEDKYRYKIYRNNEPITSENILESDEIANLARGSGKMQWALEWADFTD